MKKLRQVATSKPILSGRPLKAMSLRFRNALAAIAGLLYSQNP